MSALPLAIVRAGSQVSPPHSGCNLRSLVVVAGGGRELTWSPIRVAIALKVHSRGLYVHRLLHGGDGGAEQAIDSAAHRLSWTVEALRLRGGLHRPQRRPGRCGGDRVPRAVITGLVDRHAAGDWGEVDADDKAANDAAARTGDGRLFSSYATPEHGTLRIITDDIRGEGEGPITTVLFPDDY